jgi:heme O synthase-like polyprenyltransferase
VLFTKKILLPRSDNYNAYIAGIGVGTFVGNCLFIFGGMLIASSINRNQHIVSWVIGGIFLATAVFQVWQMWRRKKTDKKFIDTEAMKEKLEKKFDKLVKKKN